jgi:hypothetical protein
MATVRGIRFILVHKCLTTGVVRVLIQDDHFEDYYFPKEHDSVSPFLVLILILAWSSSTICLDPNEYDDPTRFYPERFLNEDLYKPLAGHWAFGMGRRGKPF